MLTEAEKTELLAGCSKEELIEIIDKSLLLCSLSSARLAVDELKSLAGVSEAMSR